MDLARLIERLGRRREAPAPEPVPAPPPAAPAVPAISAAPQAAPAAKAALLSGWPPARIELAEELWGDGFTGPGGPEEVRRLIGPFGLTAAASLLLLGAGGGGPALAAAGAGAWVSGFEADPGLVAHARARLQSAGKAVAERAAVACWNPASPALKRHGFHHALALDALRGGPPAGILAAVAAALKPQGQLMIVQTVAAAGFAGTDPPQNAWLRLERLAAPPPDEPAVTAALLSQGIELWVTEDVTAHHTQLAMAGWTTLVRALEGPRPSPPRAAAIVAEAELWLTRLRLMQSGRLRVVRWHGRSPPAA